MNETLFADEFPYTLSTDQVLSLAGDVSPAEGLPDGEVQKRAQRFGPNQLAEAPPVPALRKLAAQFTDLVIWILIVAAVISGLMQAWADYVTQPKGQVVSIARIKR